MINAIPEMDCLKGCIDCCCPVPFTLDEWRKVPLEFKKGLDIIQGEQGSKLIWLPMKPGYIHPARMKAGGHYEIGEIMRGFKDKEEPECPFAEPFEGCRIYAYRPLLCRLFGVVAHPMMICRRGFRPRHLLKHEVAAIMIMARYGFMI